jgi:hypothetical protein
MNDEEDQKQEFQYLDLSPGDTDDIDIYQYGRMEGTCFLLNEPLTVPGGATVEKIDFTRAFAGLDEIPEGLLEDMIAAFLKPSVLARSKPVPAGEAQRLDSMLNN